MEIQSEKVRIKDLLHWKRKNILTSNPEYQRSAVWQKPQQKKLIDSVLRKYPLPLIYIHVKEEIIFGNTHQDLEIIDGQQRINALFDFAENKFKLFDPEKDDKIARFPNFIKNAQCPWASCDFGLLTQELKEQFDNTELFVVKITTDVEDEARDLFIRLQAGLPLNSQEKRDAWPGAFTEFILRIGGKKENPKYPGHKFFQRIPTTTDRGGIRQLCAQISMLYFENATKGNWIDIGAQRIDDYYYSNLGFDFNTPKAIRFIKILDKANELFEGYKGFKLKAHEAINIVLLIDSIMDDYTKSWEDYFIKYFDLFREEFVKASQDHNSNMWLKYATHTQTQASNARTLQLRYKYFSEFFMQFKVFQLKDELRLFGELERQRIYFHYKKKCVVCDTEINWDELEIHHLEEHHVGGKTSIENGVPVHKDCHPRSRQDAIQFFEQWKLKGVEPLKELEVGKV